jgi:putative NADH-flavin reductase
MKLAIIGATGFVGSHVLKEALQRNHSVTAIARTLNKITDTHPNLNVQNSDIFNSDDLLSLLKGADAVLSAYNPGWKNPNLYDEFIAGSKAIQHACLDSGIKRLLVVGGAGSLEVAPGIQLVDSPDFPAEWKEGARAARDYLSYLRAEKDLDWTFLSPAIEMHPGTSGVRRGHYRVGTDQPVFDMHGKSQVSVEDVAVALLDETENPKFIKQRFTIAY